MPKARPPCWPSQNWASFRRHLLWFTKHVAHGAGHQPAGVLPPGLERPDTMLLEEDAISLVEEFLMKGNENSVQTENKYCHFSAASSL